MTGTLSGPDAALLVAANVGLWVSAHVLTSYFAHRLPARWLGRDRGLLRLASWEYRGRWYERHLRVSAWKDHVPEAGAVFKGGVSKRRLLGRDGQALTQFAVETRRGEIAHWTCLLAVPVAALWNPPAGVAFMAVYGVSANLPCIIIQRYNRARISHVLRRRAGRTVAA